LVLDSFDVDVGGAALGLVLLKRLPPPHTSLVVIAEGGAGLADMVQGVGD
jgi:hypothetical protein